MLNQLVICGRLVSDPVKEKNEEGKELCYVTVAVPRAYKNEEGIYDTDFIKCQLWNGVEDATCEYCHKGDIVGIKGRVQSELNDDGENVMMVIAEKVSFLSSKKKEDNDGEE